MKTIQIFLSLFATCSVMNGLQQGPIVIENAHLRYTISPDGKNLGFLDLASGTDYLRHDIHEVVNGCEHPLAALFLYNAPHRISFAAVYGGLRVRIATIST